MEMGGPLENGMENTCFCTIFQGTCDQNKAEKHILVIVTCSLGMLGGLGNLEPSYFAITAELGAPTGQPTGAQAHPRRGEALEELGSPSL